MWCPQCQADVATEIAPDGQALLCVTCESEVRKVFAPSLHPETRSARDLLDRWAADELLEDLDATAESRSLPASEAMQSRRTAAGKGAGRPRPVPRQSPNKPKLRVDSAHSQEEVIERRRPAPPAETVAAASMPATPPPQRLPAGYRQDGGHAALGAPHFDIQTALRTAQRSGRGESLWGQLLAYAGVGVLTIGTVLVLWGHFGGFGNYASTGWLVATGGQMLLFLGVVTLVSGGMQQTTHEVTQRVEHIGDRIYRIEQATQDLLQGPHFGRSAESDVVHSGGEQYANDDA